MEHVELNEEMEMPCPCQRCGEWFDLNDGRGSQKWYPNVVICDSCGSEEQDEVDLDNEIEALENQISDTEDNISGWESDLE